jgi:hypothetical protein
MSSYRYGIRTRLTGAGYTARVAQWGQRSLIKSIQRGTIAVPDASADETITAVVVGNSRLMYLGDRSDSAGTFFADDFCVKLILANATTITATRGTTAGDAAVSYEIVEYWPGVIRSVQRSTIAITTGNTSNTAAITAVNSLAKTTCDCLGYQSSSTDTTLGRATLVLTNATTVTANLNTAAGNGTLTVGFQVIEWW